MANVKFFENVRQDFPTLKQTVNDESLIYFDNAATTQKPEAVLTTIDQFYRQTNANIHRGIHTLAEQATEEYEAVREDVREFINATETAEIIFTKGTTEGLNWLASNQTPLNVGPDDEIIVSVFEHHANFLPWQRLAKQTGAQLKVVGMDVNGHLDFKAYDEMICSRTKIVAMTMMSNVTGEVPNIEHIIERAHAVGALVVGDAAQAIAHLPVDVKKLDIDFMVFSGHKLYAPLGVGVLYGKKHLLEEFEPFEVGGGIVTEVSVFGAEWLPLPWRLEAGTPDIAAVIGLGKAIQYLKTLGLTEIFEYESELALELWTRLSEIKGVELVGTTPSSIVSFNLTNIHPHDAATAFDQLGIAVRAGNHCAQPLMNTLGIKGTLRVSLAFYNTFAEVKRFIQAVEEVKEYFNDVI
ncbi:MAG: SufS family cysteine desulfurase [Lactobacillaceae bacterium]|jgi:cysteine desulfurase/selenocysteine lyase|nr:SufS family cysteine desulfurase [Lactobacillaceae bacterium]